MNQAAQRGLSQNLGNALSLTNLYLKRLGLPREKLIVLGSEVA